MRFWDTSALVPLFLREPTTEQLRRLHREDEQIHAWWASGLRAYSACTHCVPPMRFSSGPR